MRQTDGFVLLYLCYSLISLFLFLVILDEPELSVVLFLSDDMLGHIHEIQIRESIETMEPFLSRFL